MSITNEVLAEGERLFARVDAIEAGGRGDWVDASLDVADWLERNGRDLLAAVRASDSLRGKLADMHELFRMPDETPVEAHQRWEWTASEVRALRAEVNALRAELAEARNG